MFSMPSIIPGLLKPNLFIKNYLSIFYSWDLFPFEPFGVKVPTSIKPNPKFPKE